MGQQKSSLIMDGKPVLSRNSVNHCIELEVLLIDFLSTGGGPFYGFTME